MRHAAVIVLSLSTFGCAAVFRGTTDTITIDSAPTGAEAKKGGQRIGVTPTMYEADRSGVTQVSLSKPGYEEHNGTIKKRINAGWLTADILTCAFPVALCIPLIVDAISGAWFDLPKRYVASMKPSGSTGGPLVAGATTPESTPPPVMTSRPAPSIELSESERKATARAAYLEGVKLQEAGNCAEALSRFEAAQKFYSAPTHVLHIAQCQRANGKLVESSESYETLVRMPLANDAPEVFRQVQDDGKKELAQLRPRVPTLRVQVTPSPSSLSSLVVKLNGHPIPNEVLGIARPVNPGKYKVTVWAAGYKEASGSVDVGEGAPRAIDLVLSK
jgi:PEGA domain-containing protein